MSSRRNAPASPPPLPTATAPCCQVESGSMVAAGAVVDRGTTVPSGELWAGNPAKRLRELKEEEKAYLETLPAR